MAAVHGIDTADEGCDLTPTPLTTITRYACFAPGIGDRSTNRMSGNGGSGVSW
jgi:hypothetical protein